MGRTGSPRRVRDLKGAEVVGPQAGRGGGCGNRWPQRHGRDLLEPAFLGLSHHCFSPNSSLVLLAISQPPERQGYKVCALARVCVCVCNAEVTAPGWSMLFII